MNFSFESPGLSVYFKKMDNYLHLPKFSPILVDLPGPPAVSWYGLMYLLGVVFVYFFVHYHIRTRKIDLEDDQFLEILLRAFLGVIVGGRLGFCFFVEPGYYLRNPLEIFYVWDGGMYFFGGMLLAMLFPVFYIRRIGKNYFDLADLVVIPVPMALGFGRIGNFINGEFWGRPSAVPWAMVFPTVPKDKWFAPGSDELLSFLLKTRIKLPVGTGAINTGPINLPRHPVQLYELVLEGVVLFLILLLFRNTGPSKPRGSVISLFLLLYGLFRFLIEFYREPVEHSAIIAGDWFTISMLFSVPMILLGGFGLLYAYNRNLPNLLYEEGSEFSSVKKSPPASSSLIRKNRKARKQIKRRG